jgi:hypothetical protein
MVGAAMATWGLVSSPVFGLDRVDVTGAGLTPESMIDSTLRVTDGSNLVTLDTSALEERLERLPTISRADVAAGLPGTLRVVIDEPRPILAWTVAGRRLLVDIDGEVVAELGAEEPLPRLDRDGRVIVGKAAARGAGAAIGVLDDQRSASGSLRVGSTLDPTDLDAARRLGSLRPADAGSRAPSLALRVTDGEGFVLGPAAGGWQAVFGFYTPTLRSPDMIPGQVRLLRSLLATGEGGVGLVVLASESEGTYVPAPSPAPAASAAPSAAPSPAAP